MVRGDVQYNKMSRFVKEIPMDLLDTGSGMRRAAGGGYADEPFGGAGAASAYRKAMERSVHRRIRHLRMHRAESRISQEKLLARAEESSRLPPLRKGASSRRVREELSLINRGTA